MDAESLQCSARTASPTAPSMRCWRWRWCWCLPSPGHFIPRVSFSPGAPSRWRPREAGHFPATVWLLVGCGVTLAVDHGFSATGRRSIGRSVLWNLAYPLRWRACCGRCRWPTCPPPPRVLIALAIVVPMGPMLYRVAFQPVAEAPVLVLLIISVAVHLAMVGLGLLIFGPEGSRTQPFSDAQFGSVR